MATQAELAADLATVIGTVDKIKGETQGLVTKVGELEALLAAGGTVIPEVQAKLDELKTKLKAVDDLVADAPAPAPEPTPVP